jgi:hypothetical protein
MFALNLWKGLGTKRDVPRALEVLPGGCRRGTDDPACQAAFKIERAIQAEGAH